MVGRTLAFLVLALCWLLPTATEATPHDSAEMSGLLVDGGGGALAHEVTIACAKEELTCNAHLAWILPAAEEPRRAVIYLLPGTVDSLTIDGRTAAYGPGDDPFVELLPPDVTRAEFTLPATADPVQIDLRVSLPLVSTDRRCSMGRSSDLAEVRHISQGATTFAINLDGRASWPDDPPPVVVDDDAVEIQLDLPRHWGLSRRAWTFERGEDRLHATSKVGALHINSTDRRWAHGPALAIGARLRGRDVRPWLRGGWEFSRIPLLVHSIAAESDLRRLVVVPSTEVGTPAWFIIPSVSGGLGLPVRVYPDVRPGGRVWMGLNFPYISLVGGYDVFPRMAGHRTEHVGHVGLQFTL